MKRSLVRGSVPLLALLFGCTVFEARPDATRTFVLSATPPPGAGSPADVALAVSVGPVRLPDYLLRPEFMVRAGENQLEPSSVDRWAEPIDHAFQRVLTLDLAAALPKSTVVAFPPSRPDDVALFVSIDVAGFEGGRAGHVRLDARWTLRDARTGSQIVRESKLERAAASGETPALVAAMSALLGDLAAAVAREITK